MQTHQRPLNPRRTIFSATPNVTCFSSPKVALDWTGLSNPSQEGPFHSIGLQFAVLGLSIHVCCEKPKESGTMKEFLNEKKPLVCYICCLVL